MPSYAYSTTPSSGWNQEDLHHPFDVIFREWGMCAQPVQPFMSNPNSAEEHFQHILKAISRECSRGSEKYNILSTLELQPQLQSLRFLL
jgi:hypothetical protein